MRKFLAALLAVLMLVTIVLPVAAKTDNDYTTSDDGTGADDANNLNLIITEFLGDSRSPDAQINWDSNGRGTDTRADDGDPQSYNGFSYIEIYNNGKSDIDLYGISIAASMNYVTSAANDANQWETTHLFNKKMSLKAGSIFDGITFASTEQKNALTHNGDTEWCRNPTEAVLQPGQFAIIWFWNDSTNTVMNSYVSKGYGESFGKPVADKDSGELIYHKGFRDWYNVDEDALVLAVYAGTDKEGTGYSAGTKGSRFSIYDKIYNDTGYSEYDSPVVYALIDERVNRYDIGTPAWTEGGGYDPRILCTWEWGVGTSVGITSDENKSTVFVPSNATPDLYNRLFEQTLNEEEMASYTPAANYYEIGYTMGFKQMAVVSFSEEPTPGTMADWQWAYIAPTRVNPDKYVGSTLDAWKAQVINAYITAAAPEREEEEGKKEDKIDVIFKDREDLGNQGSNQQKKDPNVKKGLPTWALILIIAGGVVLVAAAAVVVLVVIKKKNKPVAADDVAAEGEVKVIDENQAE